MKYSLVKMSMLAAGTAVAGAAAAQSVAYPVKPPRLKTDYDKYAQLIKLTGAKID